MHQPFEERTPHRYPIRQNHHQLSRLRADRRNTPMDQTLCQQDLALDKENYRSRDRGYTRIEVEFNSNISKKFNDISSFGERRLNELPRSLSGNQERIKEFMRQVRDIAEMVEIGKKLERLEFNLDHIPRRRSSFHILLARRFRWPPRWRPRVPPWFGRRLCAARS